MLFLRFAITHFVSCLHPFQCTEKLLENSYVHGGRASVGKVAAAAGTYRNLGGSDDDVGDVESDDDVEELEDSDSDDDDTTTTNMVTKTKR